MNRIIKILGVAKSSIYYQARTYPKRKKTIKKYLSDAVKANIRSISSMTSTARRTAYGTPRVRAILQRDYGVTLSKYMVHRFMKEEGLLLKRFRTRGNSRIHTGKIAVVKSNTRWASDITGRRPRLLSVGMVKNFD